jgi:hypothetical protein
VGEETEVALTVVGVVVGVTVTVTAGEVGGDVAVAGVAVGPILTPPLELPPPHPTRNNRGVRARKVAGIEILEDGLDIIGRVEPLS